MSQTEPNLNYITFALSYIGAVILVTAIGMLLQAVAGINLPTGLTTILPSMMAAVYTGWDYAKSHGIAPSNAVSWSGAGITTVIEFAISIPLAAMMIYFVMPDFFDKMPGGMLGVMAALLGFLALVSFLLKRFMFPFGAKQFLNAKK